jgi:hypothetical protein
MNINTVWSNTIDSISSVKDKVVDKYNNTNMNPFPKKLEVELVINYDKSLKTINIEEVKKLFKIIKSEIDKELK